VLKFVMPWNTVHYEVLSNDGSYLVHPSLLNAPSTPAFCTCPTYTNVVLIQESYLMCKHVLAVRIAERLSLCVEKHPTKDD
ncbi:hypothetical protein K488DRAFT_36532, partial [Vararia minispora EC-137]